MEISTIENRLAWTNSNSNEFNVLHILLIDHSYYKYQNAPIAE